jgi:GNAT superfamily N-acetyltransferase
VSRGKAAIRRARPEEVESLWKLVAELASYEKLEHLFTGSAEALSGSLFGDGWPRIEAFVAEDRGALVGYAIFYGGFSTFWTKPLLWLEDLYVTESRRGEGIGRDLLAAVARVALERGSPRVDWAVLDWNQPSIDFYERLGATRQGGWYNYRIEGAVLEKLAASG